MNFNLWANFHPIRSRRFNGDFQKLDRGAGASRSKIYRRNLSLCLMWKEWIDFFNKICEMKSRGLSWISVAHINWQAFIFIMTRTQNHAMRGSVFVISSLCNYDELKFLGMFNFLRPTTVLEEFYPLVTHRYKEGLGWIEVIGSLIDHLPHIGSANMQL